MKHNARWLRKQLAHLKQELATMTRLNRKDEANHRKFIRETKAELSALRH